MKRILLGFLITLAIVGAAGCGGQTRTNAGFQGMQGSANGQEFLNQDPSKMPLQMKLGIGTLKLNGSDLAITPAQAKTLLPLWKALKSLSSDTNTTAEEINALTRQIEEAMTADQLEAIKKMTWTQEDMRALLQQNGTARSQGAAPAGSSTTQAQGREGNFRGGAGGPPMGGPPMGGGGMIIGPGGAGMENPSAARTAVPGQQERREAAGMNLMFVDPVIKLLESLNAG